MNTGRCSSFQTQIFGGTPPCHPNSGAATVHHTPPHRKTTLP
ncbi:hypothetical protein A2U01_0082853 [Trifolium medium]|uniref:Uncharacterized protein n=1 Tax=Trifolium medium TaxID=97028 RepID=A0A392TN81_9FABA|nr:hypothetical protein [Trifolium medium]